MSVLPVNRRRMNTFQHCCLCVGEREREERVNYYNAFVCQNSVIIKE